MIKRLKYIFIPVLAVLLMSHNTFAVDISPNAYPIWANANPLCSFYNPASGTWINNSFSNNSTGTTATYSISKINCDYPNGLSTKNTYAVYSFRFDNFAYDNSADSGWLATKSRQISGDGKFGVIGQTISAMGSTGWQIDVYLYGEGVSTAGGTFQLYNPLNDEELFFIKPQERVTFVGASYWRVENQTNYTSILNDIYDRLVSLRNTNNANQLNILHVTEDINSKLEDINDSLNDSNEHYQKEEEAAGDISDQSPSDIGNSENAATTNLVGALSGFFTTIANAPATNCLINGDLGNLNIGGIDLCQGKENFNTLVEFIGFTALFGVVFWASYHLIKKTLALIDWARSK